MPAARPPRCRFTDGLLFFLSGIIFSHLLSRLSLSSLHTASSAATPSTWRRALSTAFRAAPERALGDLRARPFPPDAPLAFLHIPKTAGVTLRYALIRAWRAMGCHYVDTQNTSTWTSPWLTEERCAYCPTGLDGSEFPLLAAAATSGAALTYSTGHDPYGACLFFQRGCRYATVLRDPVERLLSHYHYLRRLGVLNDTLEAFVERVGEDAYGEGMLSNLMTRYVAGTHFYHKLYGSELCGGARGGRSPNLTLCSVHRYERASEAERAEVVALAKAHLEADFALVGFTEDLGDFFQQVRQRTIIPLAHPRKIREENRGPQAAEGATHTQTTPPALIARILQQQAMDVEVYDWAVQRYGSPALQQAHARQRQLRREAVELAAQQRLLAPSRRPPPAAAPDFGSPAWRKEVGLAVANRRVVRGGGAGSGAAGAGAKGAKGVKDTKGAKDASVATAGGAPAQPPEQQEQAAASSEEDDPYVCEYAEDGEPVPEALCDEYAKKEAEPGG